MCSTNMLPHVRQSTKIWKDCILLQKERDHVFGQAGTGIIATIIINTVLTYPLKVSAVPQSENSAQTIQIQRQRDRWNYYDEYAKGHFQNWFLELLQEAKHPTGRAIQSIIIKRHKEFLAHSGCNRPKKYWVSKHYIDQIHSISDSSL